MSNAKFCLAYYLIQTSLISKKMSSLKTKKSDLPAGAWRTVYLLSIVACLNYLDRNMIITMRESIVSEFSISEAQFGLLYSVFLWVYGILSPFAGFLADRFNKTRIIIGSLFLWSCVTWLTAHSSTFEELLATRVLLGIVEACYVPAALALIVEYHKKHTRSLAVGIHMAGLTIGSSLAFIGGWLAEIHKWNAPFAYFGIVGIAYGVLLIFKLHDLPSKEEDASEAKATTQKLNFFITLKELFSRRSFIFFITAWGLLGFISWGVSVWLPTFFQEQFNISQTLSGIYGTLYFHPAALLGILFAGAWTDRWSRKNFKAPIFVTVISLFVAFPFLMISSFSTTIILAIVCLVIYSFMKNFITPNGMPILCLIVDFRHRGTAYGILNLVACVIGGISIYGGGYLRDANIELNLVLRVMALIGLIATGFILFVKPTEVINKVE